MADWSFSDLLSGIGDWFGSKGGQSVLQAGATGLGALYTANANQNAADTRSDATIRAAEIAAQAAREGRGEMRAGANRGIEAINAGTENYARTIAPLMTRQPVMLPTYRGLTAADEIARADLQRTGRNTVATSGLRGSGAGVKSLLDADRRFVAGATTQNDNRRLAAMQDATRVQDNATSGLAQVRAQAGGSIANTEIGVGNNMANSITQAGNTVGNAVAQVGGQQADASIANAGITGDALGAIGSIFAGQAKDANRNKYASNSPSV